jgi:hypothetical protein
MDLLQLTVSLIKTNDFKKYLPGLIKEVSVSSDELIEKSTIKVLENYKVKNIRFSSCLRMLKVLLMLKPVEPFNKAKKFILDFVQVNRSKSFWMFICLCKIQKDYNYPLDDLEDIFINRYICKVQKNRNLGLYTNYIAAFLQEVPDADKNKILKFAVKNSISKAGLEFLITMFPKELNKYQMMI